MIMNSLLMIIITATPTAIPTPIPTAIPTASINSSTSLDLSISIAVIIAITALISPIIVAIINNKHQYKMKNMEYEAVAKSKEIEMQFNFKSHQWDTYYTKATIVFEELAKNVGTFLGDTSYIEPYSKSLASINQARVYADSELQILLDVLMAHIVAFDNSGSMLTNVKANKGSTLNVLGEVIISANRMISIK
jgi:hypothetical protein